MEKDQVIEALEKQIRITESVDGGWVYLTIENARKALELLAVAKDINVPDKWISVKDRMPELGDHVLFTGLSSFGTRFITQRGWFDGTFWKRDSGETVYSLTPVTHWMLLPEPPKEESND